MTVARAAAPGLDSYTLKALRPAAAEAAAALADRCGVKPRGDWLAKAIRQLPADDPTLLAYASSDAVETARLWDELVADSDHEHSALDVEIERLWRWVGYDGLAVDRATLAARTGEIERLLADETARFGFAPHTGNSARIEFVESLGVTGLGVTDTGKPCLNAGSRARAIVPPEHRSEWNRLCAAIEASFDRAKLDEISRLSERDGRVHPYVNANLARTGRQSVSDPALQNLAAALRPLLIADPVRVLVGCDLSQGRAPDHGRALRRPGAHRGGDDRRRVRGHRSGLRVVDRSADGQDRVPGARLRHGRRRSSGEARREPTRGGGGARSRAGGLSTAQSLDRRRAPLHTITGRPLPAASPDKSYVAVNYLIQGSAADLFKRMTLRACAALPAHARPWLPVHDELVVECDPADAEMVMECLREHMREVVEGVVIDGEPVLHGERWGKS